MITLAAPWLEYDLGAPHQVLSWSVNRPGYQTARRILWREIRNADLPPGLDVGAWLARELAARGSEDAICLLTSRRIDRHVLREATENAVTAQALATVGLSNAERVGHRMDRTDRDWNCELGAAYGTINIAVKLNHPLSQTGLLEALSIATQARTAAIMDAGHRLPSGTATGTGTDCIAMAAPEGADDYAGLHTDTGIALGRAVYDAVLQGAQDWTGTIGRVTDERTQP
ncbi:adenosylcobinamide amidohydrolase [Pararhodobacter sp.]|uniref:adenosylcobinamide amidohydrolase n=1 Tax=Pararhodobacter sp. TaxID=2127056 RepID=UPI002FDD1735